MNESEIIEQSKKAEEFDTIYNNVMQMVASIVDAKIEFVEAGRAAGKTTWFGPRLVNVAYDMPGELSFFVHKTYMALLTNIIPNLVAYLKTPQGNSGRPLLREGIDFVIGEKDLPVHFNHPIYPIENPKHSIVFADGHQVRLTASDQPESVAGANGVHAFIEEMKHNKGERIKTRIIPALRGGTAHSRKSHYYQGITGISDTARVDMGEDDWFTEFEKQINHELIKEIVTVALHVNKSLFIVERNKMHIKQEKDESRLKRMQKEINLNIKTINRWAPTLRQMRKAAVFYLKASSFVNKDFLGFDFFKTQYESLNIDEFLAAIANIRPKKVVDMFFSGFDNKKHTFSDGYIYKSIAEWNIKDTFKLSAEYLKYFQPDQPLIFGYDPGHFSSIVVSQENKKKNELRIIKEFYCWIPKQQGDLAKDIFEFFGRYHKSKRIILYYDRAGNKRKEEDEKITTDARLLKKELETYGFRVDLKNEKQRTIFYYEHFKILSMLFSGKFRSLPTVLIDENECPNLISSINISAVDRKDGKIALDKTSERKIPLQHQAALTTQLSSAATYLLYGLYSNQLPREMQKTSDIPLNINV